MSMDIDDIYTRLIPFIQSNCYDEKTNRYKKYCKKQFLLPTKKRKIENGGRDNKATRALSKRHRDVHNFILC